MSESNATDEFMLVSKANTLLLNQPYKLASIILSNGGHRSQPHSHSNAIQHHQQPPLSSFISIGMSGGSGGNNSDSLSSGAQKRSIITSEKPPNPNSQSEISLKFYVLLVNEEKCKLFYLIA